MTLCYLIRPVYCVEKLNKVLEKCKEPFNSEDGLVDWAQAEQLARLLHKMANQFV